MGGLSAAATGGNIKEGIIEGTLTGVAGSVMGLASWNPLLAGIVGAGIDFGIQVASQVMTDKKVNLKEIDYGRTLKTGIQTGIGVVVPPFAGATEKAVYAIGTVVAWSEVTVLIVATDIVTTNVFSDTGSQKSMGRIRGISYFIN